MVKRFSFVVIAGLLLTASAQGETLNQALALAYQNNPSLAAARAEQRANDEGVAQAKALFRPSVNLQLDGTKSYTDSFSESSSSGGSGRSFSTTDSFSGSLNLTQRLYNGGASVAGVKQAKASAKAGQYALFNTTQNILLQAVQAYMNVLRDNAVVHLRKRNIEVLRKELKSTKDRFEVGEVTRTDVAQSEARLASAQASLQSALATAEGSKASYVEIIGVAPTGLQAPMGVSNMLPRSLDEALEYGYNSHPAVLSAIESVAAAQHNVDVQTAQIKPKLSFIGSGSQSYSFNSDTKGSESFSASAKIQAEIPIYNGGGEYASIRQAKQQLSQQKYNRDARIAEVRAAVITAWYNLSASKDEITAARASVRAAEVALNGVIEEVKVGQRTTLDLLNSRQELLDSRVALVTAERNAVVSAYSLISSIGEMSPERLGLEVVTYDPNINLINTEDKWIGLRIE